MRLLANFLAFQVGWFASVIGAARHLPWIGPLAVLAIVAWHLAQAERPWPEFQLIVICAAVGGIFDSVLVAQGWVSYPSGQLFGGLAPFWIVGMWMLFATTLNLSLNWLKNRWLLGAILGALAAPLSYVAGEKLGGIELIDRPATLASLAVGWSVILPALQGVASHFNGITPVVVDKVA